MRAAMPRGRSHSSSFGANSTAAGALGLEMTPTVLMMGIEEKLLVPFGAQDRAGHDTGLESEFPHGFGDAVTGGLVEWRIPNDASLADLTLPDLELRFDQYNHLPGGA